jgi:hypothetical protein
VAFRGRGKGSSDVIKRGSAIRPTGPEKFELFPSSHEVAEPLPLLPEEESLVNTQRLLVNHMLASQARVHLGVAETHMKVLNGADGDAGELWRRLATDVGAAYYPQELMTDSKSVLFGIPKKSSNSAVKVAKSLIALESSEQKNPDVEGGEQSPKSNPEELESSSDESVAGDDYNVRLDFEDEGARDDYDDGMDDGGGDYGGEF